MTLSAATKADRALRKEFAMPNTTSVILPAPGGIVLQLSGLTEGQARVILRAARLAGVEIDKP